MESVEASGKSIEDAILQALARLGRNRDEVEISVLQEPSRGARGMGAREARVRVYVTSPGALASPKMAGAFAPDEEFAGEYPGEYATDDAYAAPADGATGEDGDEAVDGDDAAPHVMLQELTTAALSDVLPEDATVEEIAIETLRMLLAHMGVQAEFEVLDGDEDTLLTLNIQPLNNQPISYLIGRRGETLAALQLIVNLIVSRQSGRRERITVDAEGYRERRTENLRSMAQRIAQQVRHTGNPIVLEAMPPNERRIIHMALAEISDISTESTGEGEQRRVVVSLRPGSRSPA
ncbi:MAG: RNA-binding cell elongation regulator Jag/EloR [Ktedonobacterales bacterium]